MRHGLACWKCWSGLSTVWVLRLIFSIQREPNRPASVVLFYAVGNSTVHLNVKTRSKEVEFTLALTHGTSLSPTATTSIVSFWQGNQLEKFLVVAVGKQC